MHDITSGEIFIQGKSITKAHGKALLEMRRNIGMIFQHFNLVKRSSVLRNVLSGRVGYHPTWKMVLGLFPKEDKIKAMDALERVNILDKYNQRSNELSGGQQQRISIARALCQESEIILADEPVASLDPLTTKQVMDDLRKINQELGITILINLHFVDLAKNMAHASLVYVMVKLSMMVLHLKQQMTYLVKYMDVQLKKMKS